MKQALIIFVVLFAVYSICTAEETPEQIVKKVEDNFNKSGAMSIDFKEIYQWKLTGEEHTTNGNLVMQGQDKFRVSTDDQIIVSNGSTLWTFSKPSNRVVVDKLKKNDNTLLPRKIFLEYTEDYRVFSDGSESLSGTECWVLKFTDEKGDKLFPKVRVWIDKHTFMPGKIEQWDLSGNVTIFIIKKIKTGITVSKNEFYFKTPEGAELIDLRSM